MINMTCKCGKSEMTFKNLSEKDFPKGWESDCCTAGEDAEEQIEVKGGEQPEQTEEAAAAEKAKEEADRKAAEKAAKKAADKAAKEAAKAAAAK